MRRRPRAGTANASTGEAGESSAALLAALAAMALVAAGLFLFVSVGATPASARPTGITGYSGNPNTGGSTCTTCHSGAAPAPTVTIDGPETLAAGETGLFTVTVSGGPGAVAGFNASTLRSSGVFASTDGSVQSLGNEITHTAPQAMVGGSASFDFEWTAPAASAVVQFWAAGLSGNGNGNNQGDAAAGTTLAVDVVGDVPEVAVSVECVDDNPQLAFAFVNPFSDLVDYQIDIDGAFDSVVNLFPNEEYSQPVDTTSGGRQVVVTRDSLVVFDDAVVVDCAVDPEPDQIVGADGPIEVSHVVSCLAGNGRVDTNIVNTGPADALYRIEFEGLSPREWTVGAGDWWRMPITGRPDRDFEVVVKRDGVIASSSTVTVSCDTNPPVIGEPEVQLVNSCRAANGYLLFQFLNDTDASKSYIIEFEGVPNRSTTASAHGQAVRAVTGRPDGVYDVLVRTGSTPVASFQVTIACD